MLLPFSGWATIMLVGFPCYLQPEKKRLGNFGPENNGYRAAVVSIEGGLNKLDLCIVCRLKRTRKDSYVFKGPFQQARVTFLDSEMKKVQPQTAGFLLSVPFCCNKTAETKFFVNVSAPPKAHFMAVTVQTAKVKTTIVPLPKALRP